MGNTVKIVTFNLRFGWEPDGIKHFLHRIGIVFEKIQKEMPDIIGFQEVRAEQFIFLERLLTEYRIVGQYRDADFTGEGLFVAVKKDSYDIIEYNTFWMSPTPYVSGSRFENQSECPRICNVVKARHKTTGKMIRILNLHLDHISDEARILGMECVLGELKKLNDQLDLPFVIMGDFNAEPGSETINMCESYEAFPMVDAADKFEYTFHGFGLMPKTKIDYLYIPKDMKEDVLDVVAWDDEVHGIPLSDHFPISMIIQL